MTTFSGIPGTPTSRRTTAAVVAGLLTALTLTACSADEPVAGSRGIDARSYVDDYEEGEGDGGGVAYSQAMPEEAAPAGSDAGPDAGSDAGSARAPSPPSTRPALPPDVPPDTFVDAGTSGFVDPREDALSTFALDVDTGSFGVARTLLREGQAVPPAAIRPEEWVNALPYDDLAPTDADLGLSAETGTAPSLDDGTQVVRVGVAAREVDPDDRPRVHVTLVVDRSGSMDEAARLGLVRSSLALLADRLHDDDTVAVVSFEDEARPILEPTPASETDAILDAIEDLEPGGSTNLEAGLTLGYEQAREAFDPEGVNLVVLASDGVANVGSAGPGSITEKIAEEGADGIHLVTVGYGMGSYNDHLMEQLADLGDGFYSYVDTFEEAERLFGEELTTTLTPVAAEARSQVAFDPELVTSYRLIGYDNRALADEDFEDLDVDAGELGAGHHATALYEVRLADGVAPGAVLGTAELRWRSVATGRAEQASIDLRAADPGQADSVPSQSFALATAAADLAQHLKGSAPYDARAAGLDDLAARVQALVDADVAGAGDLMELVELAGR